MDESHRRRQLLPVCRLYRVRIFILTTIPFAQAFWIVFWAVFVSGFAMLLALFWQPQLERAGKVMVSQPLMTGAIGLLSFFVAAILFLTIIPPVIAFFAWLFGVVAMGSEVGERFTKSLNQTWSPVLSVGFGTFLLMLVGGAVGLIPCPRRLDPLPDRHDGNRRVGDHLVRTATASSASDDRLHATHTPFGVWAGTACTS